MASWWRAEDPAAPSSQWWQQHQQCRQMQPTGFAKQQPKPLPTPPPSTFFLMIIWQAASPLEKLPHLPIRPNELRTESMIANYHQEARSPPRPVQTCPAQLKRQKEDSQKQELSQGSRGHWCRTIKLRGKQISPVGAKWLNGANAQKDCKTRERVNFL